jgi:hypothetical protein
VRRPSPGFSVSGCGAKVITRNRVEPASAPSRAGDRSCAGSSGSSPDTSPRAARCSRGCRAPRRACGRRARRCPRSWRAGRDRHGGGPRAGEIGAVLRVAQQRLHDRGQLRVLAVVQVVGLGRGEEDALDPRPSRSWRQEGVAPGPEGRQDLGHRGAGPPPRGARRGSRPARRPAPPAGRSGRNGRGRRAHDLALVGLEAPLDLAPERAARGGGGGAAARRSGRASRRDRPAAGTGPACSREARRAAARVGGEGARQRRAAGSSGRRGVGGGQGRGRRRPAGAARRGGPASRPTSRHSSCRSARGRAAIRRDSPRCRDAPSAAPQAAHQPEGWTRSDRRSSEIARVLSGQCGAGPVSAARCVS